MSYNHAVTQELRQLKDYEVLGVGACRRESLLADPQPKLLLTHPFLIPAEARPIYEAILAETLQWLKPQEVREQKFIETPFLQLLLDDLQREFPQASASIKSTLQ